MVKKKIKDKNLMVQPHNDREYTVTISVEDMEYVDYTPEAKCGSDARETIHTSLDMR